MGVLTQYENDINSGIDTDLMNDINKIGSDPLDTTAQTLSGAVNELNTLIGGIIDLIYPVGCYFETTDTTFNPNTTWSNTTWSLETEGLVHVSGGSTYTVSNQDQDGGSSTISYTPDGTVEGHKLTSAESGMPAHTITGGSHAHNINVRTGASLGSYYAAPPTTAQNSGTQVNREGVVATNSSHSHSVSATDASTAHSHGFSGTQATLDNMQPYKVVNRWHRTA